MRKIMLGAVATLGLVAVVGTQARAMGDHDTPGTPGASDCHGQTAAYLAQAYKNGITDVAFHGIGGLGHVDDLSSAEIQQVIDTYCGS